MAPADPIVSVFICGTKRRDCSSCGQRASFACSAELRGKRTGEKCGRDLCSRCNEGTHGAPLCGPHQRIARAR
jgi:hypothetical protein